MAEMIRTQKIVVPYDSTVKDEIRRLLQSVAYALRATTGTITKHSAAEVIFGRDMLIHQSRIVDWNLIRERKRKQQIKDHERENRKRIDREWKIGEECLIRTKPDERTGKLLGYEHKGPYKVRKCTIMEQWTLIAATSRKQ